jgi:phage terminase small subunit
MLTNPRHEAFAQAVALGKSGAAAYRECVSGGKCSDRTAEVASSRLLTEGSEVAVRVAELREKVAAKVEKKWLDRLSGIATAAEESEDFSAATGALREIGKAVSYYDVEQVNNKLEIVIRRV